MQEIRKKPLSVFTSVCYFQYVQVLLLLVLFSVLLYILFTVAAMTQFLYRDH